MPATDWNPRYLCYCYANGETDPEAMLTADETRHPGGRMVGFLLFIAEEKRAFYAAHPQAFLDRGWTIGDQSAWDAWLTSRYPAPQKGGA